VQVDALQLVEVGVDGLCRLIGMVVALAIGVHRPADLLGGGGAHQQAVTLLLVMLGAVADRGLDELAERFLLEANDAGAAPGEESPRSHQRSCQRVAALQGERRLVRLRGGVGVERCYDFFGVGLMGGGGPFVTSGGWRSSIHLSVVESCGSCEGSQLGNS
jgi:hypothetical protein